MMELDLGFLCHIYNAPPQAEIIKNKTKQNKKHRTSPTGFLLVLLHFNF